MQELVELALLLAAIGTWWWLRGRGTAEAECADESEAGAAYEADDGTARTTPRRTLSADTLTITEQRESVRLGHIILDWLKNIQFSDKSIREILDTGEPEAKEQMLGIVAKAFDQFSNYMARLRALNPELTGGERAQEAFRAADVLSHAIKLLAALEKPVSIAQTQQISSDVVQQPDHWDQLKDQTVDRLMDTLKGGLEETIGAMEQQEQDMERQREMIESSMHDHQHRRRRRRRKKQTSQASAKKAARDITLDDYVLGQGAHLHRKTAAQAPRAPVFLSPPPVLPPPQSIAQAAAASINIDMDLIRQLGQTLAKNSREAVTAAPASGGGGGPAKPSVPSGLAVATVNADEAPRPDDTALSAQETLRRERERGQRRPNQPRQG